LPFEATNRILNKNDFILMLVQSVELSFWIKKEKDGKLFFSLFLIF
jgi:hypothetical protein